jgi:hypothetical protein
MNRQQQHVLVGSHFHQGCSEQLTGQIKWPGTFLMQEVMGLPSTLVAMYARKIKHLQRNRPRRINALEGQTYTVRDNPCAQRFVTPDQLRETALKRISIESAMQVQLQGFIVGGAERLDLLDNPEALLGER